MARALELARRGEGCVEPNPMVGAVVVREGKIVGEGWHQQFGGPHAEINALSAAGSSARGATLVVTLEPCCHTGKTPPCSGAIRAAGVVRVIAATGDPSPQVAGGGFAQLREAGIVCEVGVLEAEARELIAPFVKLTTTARPWVIAKWAMTLDGKLATRTGSSQWISSEASREVVHQLRGRVDAIVVGAGTVRADDPLLTARPHGARTALRVVLGDIPRKSQLAKTASQSPLLVVLAEEPAKEHADDLRAAGGELLVIPLGDKSTQIEELLKELGRRQLTNVLVEGGAQVFGELFDLGAVDEVHVFIAPKIAGGAAAPSPVAGQGIADMPDALQLYTQEVRQLGDDIYSHGRLAPRELTWD